MVCINCGANIIDGVKFCPQCGTAMNNSGNGTQASNMYGFSVPTEAELGGEAPVNSEPGYNASPMSSAPGYGTPPPMNSTPGYSAPPPMNSAPGYSAPASMSSAPGYGTPPPMNSAPGYSAPPPMNSAPGYSAPPPMSSAPGYSAPPPMNSAPGYSAPAPMYGAPGYSAPPVMNGYPMNYVPTGMYTGVSNGPMNARQIVCLVFAVISTIYLGLSIILPVISIGWGGDLSTGALLMGFVNFFGDMGGENSIYLLGNAFEEAPIAILLFLGISVAVIICSILCAVSACKALLRLIMGKERWNVAIPMFSATSLAMAHIILYIICWGLYMFGNAIESGNGALFTIGDIVEISITPWGWALFVVAILNQSVFVKGYRDK